MPQFSQKYALVQLTEPSVDGFEFSMDNWPLHVTLADVFAINTEPEEMLVKLRAATNSTKPFLSKVVGEDWFGEAKNVHVLLIDKTEALQSLHATIVDILEKDAVIFNNPEYARQGFKPHATVQKNNQFKANSVVSFDAITLIDMFPSDNPYMRRVIGTLKLS